MNQSPYKIILFFFLIILLLILSLTTDTVALAKIYASMAIILAAITVHIMSNQNITNYDNK